MKKIAPVLVLVLLSLWLAACGSGGGAKASGDVKATDDLALKFIQAKIEGDHALYKTILSKKATLMNILQEGRHAHPGLFEEMGERYSIHRYEKEPTKEGTLHYKVTMYHAVNKKRTAEFLEMVKEEGQWKVLPIDGDEAERKVGVDNGVTVHEYKEGED